MMWAWILATVLTVIGVLCWIFMEDGSCYEYEGDDEDNNDSP